MNNEEGLGNRCVRTVSDRCGVFRWKLDGGGQDRDRDCLFACIHFTVRRATVAVPGAGDGAVAGNAGAVVKPAGDGDDNSLVYTVTVDGAPAEVIYADENGAEQHEQGVEGQWSKTVTFADDDRIQAGYLGANIKGEGTVTCKIEHEGQVVAESSQTGNYAYANCPIERDLD